MKAVVLENRDGYAAVLTKDGTVEKIRGTYEVGETLELDDLAPSVRGASEKTSGHGRRASVRRIYRFAAAAAAVLVVATGGIGYNTMTAQAYSYVTIDVNPSIEYTLNRLDKVIGVEALNEEASEIVNELLSENIRKKTLPEALALTEEALSARGFLTDDEDYVLIGIAPGDEGRRERLSKEAQDAFGGAGEDVFAVASASVQDRNMARRRGVSAGRFAEMRGMEREMNGISGDGGDGDVTDETFERYGKLPVEDLFRETGRIEKEEAEPVKEPEKQPEAQPEEQRKGTDAPAQENGVKPEESGKPEDGSTKPPEGGTKPQEDNMKPQEGSTGPQEGSTGQQEGSMEPQGGNAQSGGMGGAPGTGAAPNDSGAGGASGNGGMPPENTNNGNMPLQGGNAQSGGVGGAPGTGAAPNDGGAGGVPGNGGPPPENTNNGNTPPQDGNAPGGNGGPGAPDN